MTPGAGAGIGPSIWTARCRSQDKLLTVLVQGLSMLPAYPIAAQR
jgi:hypothetical protein